MVTPTKLIRISLAWWKKLRTLAHAEHRHINQEAEALFAEALAQRDHVKKLAKEHYDHETSKD